MFFTENFSLLLIVLFFVGLWLTSKSSLTNTNQFKNSYIAWASVICYAVWYPPAVLLILFHSIFAWLISGPLAQGSRRQQKFTMWGAIAVSLLILFVFKYYDFFAVDLLKLRSRPIDLILPIGISFYTFTVIGYYVDLYQRRVGRLQSFTEALLIIAFWPALASGPILRAGQFLKNARSHIAVNSNTITLGMVLIFLGMVKKLLLADNIASYVDWNLSFGIADMNVVEAWVTIVGFGAQIYFDFSGYTDMAIGFALFMGFQLPANFNYPYQSCSLTEFWRRWHISLSTWFKDYLYIPLGGNRGSFAKVALSIVVVFALSGVWHGAGLGFLAWGLVHGLFLVIEKYFAGSYFKIHKGVRFAVTFIVVMISWAFFRLEIGSAMLIIKKMLFLQGVGELSLTSPYYVLPLLVLLSSVIVDHGMKFFEVNNEGYPQLKANDRMVYYYLGAFVVLALLFSGKEQQFIYFQF